MHTRRLRHLLPLAMLLPALAGLDLAAIPNPRPLGWSVDLSDSLRGDTVRALDALGEAVQASGRGQLAVVVVRSTDGVAQRDVATRLFNRWGIGHAGRDDGVLVFVAVRDRRTEIVLGRGVDQPGAVRAVQEVVDQEMIPRFRRGDLDGGVLAGARASARRILGVDPQAGEAPDAAAAPPPAVRHTGAVGLVPAAAASGRQSGVIELDATRALAEAPPPAAGSAGRWSGSAAMTMSRIDPVLLLIGGVLGAVVLITGLRLWLRHRRRTCPDCRQAMLRLDERTDDQHLSAGERAEERVGSVDYDVWRCVGCSRVLKLRYGAWFTSYRACAGCGSRTCRRTVTTLRSATYLSGGLERVDERCAHCSFASSHTRSTPRRQRPRSSSGFGSSRSSFGSSGGSSSSSRSSGFGGGRSSGRGGGGSW